jgi:glycolate dehydrogenase FAD-binding subunit
VTQGVTMQAGIGSRFESLLGAGGILVEPTLLERYAIGGAAPSLVAQPENIEQVCAILRICNEEQWTVAPFGSGAQQHVGRLPERIDLALSTEKLNRIEAYDPGDLTISLQAGVSIAKALGACVEHRQLLAIEAASERSTVGGILATAQNGPLRTGFGSLRDSCIGISFVTGDGISGRGGGRVVKNVAGYDLMKLLIGSYGSLGVITSANFKLFPAPGQTITLICEFDSLQAAMTLRDSLIKSPLSPICCEVMNPAAIEYLHDSEPRDPDHWAPEASGSQGINWRLVLRFSGSDRVLARIRADLSSSVSSELSGAEEAELWKQVGVFEQRLAQRHRNVMIFHVEVPIAQSQAALEAAHHAATDHNFLATVIGRATVGSFVVGFLPLAIDPPAVTQYAGAASNLRSRLSKAASAVVVRCPREAKQHFDVWGSTPTDVELMRKVKRALDPGGILNRGRFLAE